MKWCNTCEVKEKNERKRCDECGAVLVTVPEPSDTPKTVPSCHVQPAIIQNGESGAYITTAKDVTDLDEVEMGNGAKDFLLAVEASPYTAYSHDEYSGDGVKDNNNITPPNDHFRNECLSDQGSAQQQIEKNALGLNTAGVSCDEKVLTPNSSSEVSEVATRAADPTVLIETRIGKLSMTELYEDRKEKELEDGCCVDKNQVFGKLSVDQELSNVRSPGDMNQYESDVWLHVFFTLDDICNQVEEFDANDRQESMLLSPENFETGVINPEKLTNFDCKVDDNPKGHGYDLRSGAQTTEPNRLFEENKQNYTTNMTVFPNTSTRLFSDVVGGKGINAPELGYQHQYSMSSAADTGTDCSGIPDQLQPKEIFLLKFSVFMLKWDVQSRGDLHVMLMPERNVDEDLMQPMSFAFDFDCIDRDLQLFTCSVEVPRRWVDHGLTYKYLVRKKDIKRTRWEFLHATATVIHDNTVSNLYKVNRHLTLLPLSKKVGIHYVFDDVFLFDDLQWNGMGSLIQRGLQLIRQVIMQNGRNVDVKVPLANAYIEKTFSAYFHMLKVHGQILLEEDTSTLNRVLQWSCFFHSYFKSSCRIEHYKVQRWEKLNQNKGFNLFVDYLEERLSKNVSIIENNSHSSLKRQINAVVDNLGMLLFFSVSFHRGCWLNKIVLQLFNAVSFEGIPVTKDDDLYESISNEFAGHQESVSEELVELWKWSMKNQISRHEDNFCYPLLLIHILSGRCHPFEKPNIGKQQDTTKIMSSWCGLDFKDDHMYSQLKLNKFFNNLDAIRTSLAIDVLLERSVAYLMAPQHYPLVASHISSGVIIRFMIDYVMNCYSLKEEVKWFAEALDRIQTKVCEFKPEYLNALLTLLEESSKKCCIRDLVMSYYVALTNLIRECYNFCDFNDTVQNDKVIRVAKEVRQSFLRGCDWERAGEAELKCDIVLVNHLINMDLTALGWVEVIEIFVGVLDKKADQILSSDNENRYITVYEEIQSGELTIHPIVGEKLDDIFALTLQNIFDKVRDITPSMFDIICSRKPTVQKLTRSFVNNWSVEAVKHNKVSELLSNKTLPYLKLFTNCKTKEKLPEMFCVTMNDIVQLTMTVVVEITQFQIDVGLLNIVKGKIDTLSDLYQVIEPEGMCNIDINEISPAVQMSSSIVESFYTFLSYVEHIVNIVNEISVAVEDLEEVKRKLCVNISNKQIREFCELLVASTNSCTENCVDQIRNISSDDKDLLDELRFHMHFNFTEEHGAILKRLHISKASGIRLFMKYLKIESETFKASGENLVVADFLDLIVQASLQKLSNDISGLLQGKVCGEELKQLFPTSFSEYDLCGEIVDLVNLLDINEDDVAFGAQECASKIKTLFDFEKSFEVSNRILALGERLNLDGEFETMKMISSQQKNIDDMLLEEVNNAFKRDLKQLQTVDQDMDEVFLVVSQCLPLIEWLREELEDPKEVKTFVDLMSSAAGESDLEIKMVTCFEASCQAFAPIIFDLNINSGFNELLNSCRKVLAAKEKDPDILQKLSDTNRHRTWYEDARKSQGSVEIKSIEQTKDANRYGKYIIGNISDDEDYFISHESSLNDVIKLVISKTESGNHDQVYESSLTMTDIDDLKSRLMLLGGDGISDNNEVGDAVRFEKEYFLQMSELIIRLATAYMALCEAGDYEYLNWRKEIKCDIEECCKQDNVHMMEEYIGELKTLEERREEWEKRLFVFRNQHRVLNFYTVKQILFLQKQISSFQLKQQVLQPQVFTLLRLVDQNIDKEKIKKALFVSSALHTTEGKVEEWDDYISEYSNFNNHSIDELKNIVYTLENEYFVDRNIAMASIIHVTPYDISEAYLWCEEQDADDPIISDLSENASVEFGKVEDSMNEKIRYKEHAEEHVDSFIPLDIFSLFLEELQSMSHRRTKRIVPEFLNNDKPNMLTLRECNILSTLIYLYSDDAYLPSPEEVIICDKDTKLEDIKLLVLRALFDPCGLYSIAFIDRLNYEISERTAQFLCQIMMEKTYNLVLFCSKEFEHSSYLSASLDSYRVYLPPGLEMDDVNSTFLSKKLRVFARTNSLCAAQVDPDEYIVRIVKSSRAGMGKSLHVSECGKKLKNLMYSSANLVESMVSKDVVVTIPLHTVEVDLEQVVTSLLEFEEADEDTTARIYHFDVAPIVVQGFDEFLFKLTVLGSLSASNGAVWRRRHTDYCLIELLLETDTAADANEKCLSIIEMLPSISCVSPNDTHTVLSQNKADLKSVILCNANEFQGSEIQRVSQYLRMFDSDPNSVNEFVYQESTPQMDHLSCLTMLLKTIHIYVPDPTWMEVRNFVHFFNTQLCDCELSAFTSVGAEQDLRGFKSFVIKFMFEMSKDFATRALNISEATSAASGKVLQQHALQRRWENNSHPYLFFNQDHVTMSFLGFCITPGGDLIDPDHNSKIQTGIMTRDLYEDLCRQMGKDFMQLNMNFNKMSRLEKLLILCRVMGVPEIVERVDPDPTYELTADNMRKMLAIHMRLRCGIPVVLMGETGCGKTRLIKFMCALRSFGTNLRNMVLVKVHGGVTEEDIVTQVNKAKQLAIANCKAGISTILFFDEANTTDAIGLIKEIMVDQRMHGKSLCTKTCGLDIIAACNPYRRHSKEMIIKLDTAGLGYHISGDKTYEKIGDIPLRELVYRVHPLPRSMFPLVWDFGQLDRGTEKSYAKQIVKHYINNGKLPWMERSDIHLLVDILSSSQEFMRGQKDECSFVSLRDVERAIQVTAWFHEKMGLLKKVAGKNMTNSLLNCGEDFRKALVLALGVCYVVRLEHREPYYRHIVSRFKGKYSLENGVTQMKEEIVSCQQLFVNELDLEKTIARNEALCENIFMMVVCIELRIPLFVVGKPGSSKSLAKTIILDSMQGASSKSELFKHFKQVHMSSYQCSPLSTADGIIGTFKQCSRFQEKKDLNTFASVVVLDEVGLAEDSPKMPLKALHPLLEDGSDGSEDLTSDGAELKNKRVAFIGISNWSLDPAKMNRGIMLCRGDPDIDELKKTALDICSSNPKVKAEIETLIPLLAKLYSDVCEKQKSSLILKDAKKEEFFALRDFYSLVKMVFSFAQQRGETPAMWEIEHCVKRNFSGLDDIDAWEIYKEISGTSHQDLHCSTLDLIQSSFTESGKNTRYLLVMTEEYAAYNILMQTILKNENNITVIFGSSFPKDLEFTQICRDINRIKICMETGKSVVLLNMENLYESLYDVLNQYYVYLGGEQFVDLGLGTHRVKCKVDKRFKLIVIADKDVVYKSYPIPLINRLEKHFLVTRTSMSEEEHRLTEQLKQWVEKVAVWDTGRRRFEPDDVFIGYNEDVCASIIIKLLHTSNMSETVLEEAKELLIQLATPDSVARATIHEVDQSMWTTYFQKQEHSSLKQFLTTQVNSTDQGKYFIQVTTFSRPLTSAESDKFCVLNTDVVFFNLVQFQTEQSFREAVKKFFRTERDTRAILIVQCKVSAGNPNLIACAQHICNELINEYHFEYPVWMVFTLHLHYKKRQFKVLGVSQVPCTYTHIDELRESNTSFPSFIQYVDYPPSSIFDIQQKGDPEVNNDIERENMVGSLVEEVETVGSSGDDQLSARKYSLGMYDETNCFDTSGGKPESFVYINENDLEKDGNEHRYNFINVAKLDSEFENEPYVTVAHGAVNPEASTDLSEGEVSEYVLEDYGESKSELKCEVDISMQDDDDLTVDSVKVDQALYIIKSCLQASVKDLNERRPMEVTEMTTLIGLMNSHLVNNEDTPTSNIVIDVILYIKKQLLKEERVMHDKRWIKKEAQDHEYLPNYGTFRQALIECIKAKLTKPNQTHQTPILTQLLQQLNYHGNIMILQNQRYNHLWLKLCHLFLNDSHQLDNVTIGNWSCKFPFFLHIAMQTENVLQTHRSPKYDSNFSSIFSTLKFSPLLRNVGLDGVLDYIHDFIHWKYPGIDEHVHMMLCDCFHLLTIISPNNEDVLPLQWIHVVYEQEENKLRLNNTLALLKLFAKTCPGRRLDFEQGLYGKEMVLDIWLLNELLRSLMLNTANTNDRDFLQVWSSKVKSLQPIYVAVWSSFRGYGKDNYGEQCFEMSETLHWMWAKIRICQLFYDTVVALSAFHPASLAALGSIATTNEFCQSSLLLPFIEGIENVLTSSISLYEEDDHNSGSYKFSCSVFFIKTIKEFVFGGDIVHDVSPGLIRKLLAYICLPGDTEPGSQCLDLPSAIQSFLLKMLLEHNKKAPSKDLHQGYVDAEVNRFFVESIPCVETAAQSAWAMYLLFLHCYEDYFAAEAARLKVTSNRDKLFVNRIISSLQKFIQNDIDGYEVMSPELLQRVAELRFTLTAVGAILQEISHLQASQDILAETDIKKLIAFLLKIIDAYRNTDVHFFLVRVINRRYGIQEFDKIVKDLHLDWLPLQNDQEEVVQCRPNQYFVYGDRYQQFHTQMMNALLEGKSVGEIRNAIEGLSLKEADWFYIILFTAQENYLDLNKVNSEMKQKLFHPSILSHGTKSLMDQLLLPDVYLSEVLYHFLVVFELTKGSTLMQPFYLMATDPAQMKDSFFPAMPSDIIEDIQAAAPANTNDKWTPYKCPNGHRYIIGDCGRPYVLGKCNVCGAVIGGLRHEKHAENTDSDFNDLSLPCHNIGPPSNRNQYAVTERSLPPLSATVQLFFVHASLLYSVLTGNEDSVNELIQPQVTGDLKSFLLEHVEHDLSLLQSLLSKGMDDVYTMIHLLLKHIVDQTLNRGNSPILNLPLTRESRKQFEMEFHVSFVKSLAQDLSMKIDEQRDSFLSDTRLCSSSVMRKLHEIDKECFATAVEGLTPSSVMQFWLYRQPNTVEHFKMRVQEEIASNEGQNYQVLLMYLNELPILDHLKELPSLVQVQKHLSHLTFSFKREEARAISIQQVIQRNISKDIQKEVKQGIVRVIKLWRELHQYMSKHADYQLHIREIPKDLNLSSPALHFFHTDNSTSIPLIQFLVSYQNNLIQQSLRYSSEKELSQPVNIINLKSGNIIDYNREDLQRLVFTYCDNSYNPHGHTRIHYNLGACEKELIDHIMYNSNLIEENYSNLNFMFIDDIQQAHLMTLSEKIQQREIPFHEQKAMMCQLPDIADVSHSLHALEIVLGILNRTGGDGNQLYKDYLSNVLLMDVTKYVPSGIMQCSVRLAHLHSAWRMLVVERAKRLHSRNERPFTIDLRCMEKLDEQNVNELRNSLRHVDSDKWLSCLSEFIVLHLPALAESEGNRSFSLKETLQAIEDQGLAIFESKVIQLDLIPEQVEVRHVYSLWLVMLALNKEIQSEM